MTIAERFDRFVAARIRRDALEQQMKDLENEVKADEAFVKDWFRDRPERRRHQGVIYSSVRYNRINAKKARQLLGARAKDAEVSTLRETLTLDAESKVVREAITLKPVRRAERVSA